MLKFLLAVLIVAFCTLLGWLAAAKYRARKNFFSQLSTFNERFLAELKYARKPLPVFLGEGKYEGDFGKTMAALSKSRAIKLNYGYLTTAEKEEIAGYLGMLGKTDSHAQNGYYAAQNDALHTKKTECERKAKARGELYLKLGFLAGLAFVILIV